MTREQMRGDNWWQLCCSQTSWVVSYPEADRKEMNRAAAPGGLLSVWANHTYTQPEVSKERSSHSVREEGSAAVWLRPDWTETTSSEVIPVLHHCSTTERLSVFQHAGSGKHAQAWFNKPNLLLNTWLLHNTASDKWVANPDCDLWGHFPLHCS